MIRHDNFIELSMKNETFIIDHKAAFSLLTACNQIKFGAELQGCNVNRFFVFMNLLKVLCASERVM